MNSTHLAEHRGQIRLTGMEGERESGEEVQEEGRAPWAAQAPQGRVGEGKSSGE